MSENPISEISDQVLRGVFKNAGKSPQCVIALTVKDGRLWMQRRTMDFPIDAFDNVVSLIKEDLEKEKISNVKEKPDGNTNKTRRGRTRAKSSK